MAICDRHLSLKLPSLSLTSLQQPLEAAKPFHILCLGNWFAMKTYSVTE